VDKSSPPVHLTFVRRNGEKVNVDAYLGQDLLSVAQTSGVELEGACEGSVACSTCHVILEPKVFDSLPSPSEDEEDMLDMAFGLTTTSRLGSLLSFLLRFVLCFWRISKCAF